MVRFGQGVPVIITGDTAGDLNVYRLHGKDLLNIFHLISNMKI